MCLPQYLLGLTLFNGIIESMSTMDSTPYRFLVIFLLLSSTLNSWANMQEGFSANGLFTIGHDDNVLRSIDNNAQSDNYLHLTPELTLLALYGKHEFEMSYAGNYKAFSDLDDFNFDEHDVSVRAKFDHTTSINSEFLAYLQEKTEQPGITNVAVTEGTNTFEESSVRGATANIEFGTQQSIGQIVLNVNAEEIDFKRASQSFRDVDKRQIIGTFFYNISPRVQVLLEGRYQEFEYDDNNTAFISQTNTATNMYLGAEWEATAASTGAVRVGYLKKDFDDDLFSDVSGLSYIIDLSWEPNSFTEFSLSSSRVPKESAQIDVAGFFSETHRVSVKHEFSRRTQFAASYSASEDEVFSVVKRVDKRKELTLGLKYSVSRSLYLGVNYRHDTRSSDVLLFNYDANIFELTLTARID
jgi:hypothetical protein